MTSRTPSSDATRRLPPPSQTLLPQPARRAVTGLVTLCAALSASAEAQPCASAPQAARTLPASSAAAEHPYLGLWVTDDGHVRHQLLPGGRYDEARGTRESAYRGRYVVTGTHIDYVDDTGFTADGDFIDGVLHHGGMVLRRVPPAAQARPRGPNAPVSC